MFWLKPGRRGGGGGHQGGQLAGWVAGPQSLETKIDGRKGLPEAPEGIPVHYPALGRPHRKAGQNWCPHQAAERN